MTAAAASGAAIDVRQITKRFNNFTAVDAITFAVERGEVFGLLPSVSGFPAPPKELQQSG